MVNTSMEMDAPYVDKRGDDTIGWIRLCQSKTQWY